MKFKTLGLEIKGYELYVDADCAFPAGICQIILEGAKARHEKKTKDSVPDQFKPGSKFNDLFGKLGL